MLETIGTDVSIAVCRWLDAHDVPGVDVRTDVRRRGGDLEVVIHRPPTETGRDGGLALCALCAHWALRDAGMSASRISISCADLERAPVEGEPAKGGP